MGVIQFKGGSIQFKGGTGKIQFKNLSKVADPTISAGWRQGAEPPPWYRRVTVTNNDTETVDVWAAATPTTYPTLQLVGSLAGGASASYDVSQKMIQPGNGETFNAYVELRQTGRTTSNRIQKTSAPFIPQIS